MSLESPTLARSFAAFPGLILPIKPVNLGCSSSAWRSSFWNSLSLKKSQVSRQQNVAFNFTRRSPGDLEKADRNLRRYWLNRSSRTPQLADQSVQLRFRQRRGRSIPIEHHLARLVPHF
jgi:hypothetical protein